MKNIPLFVKWVSFAGKFCLFERSSLFDILGNLFHFSVPYTFGTTTTTTPSPSGLDLDTLEVNRYISDPFVVGEDYTGKLALLFRKSVFFPH